MAQVAAGPAFNRIARFFAQILPSFFLEGMRHGVLGEGPQLLVVDCASASADQKRSTILAHPFNLDALALAMNNSGNWAFVGENNYGNISTFSVDQMTGSMTLTSTENSFGYPFWLAIVEKPMPAAGAQPAARVSLALPSATLAPSAPANRQVALEKVASLRAKCGQDKPCPRLAGIRVD